MKEKEIKKIVRKGYSEIAKRRESCCYPEVTCCRSHRAVEVSRNMGYTDKELKSVPDNANLGLGCGNPVALASLGEGETVLDLGSGPGLDCFLAANKVGKTGRIIGVDMTSEMIKKARANAKKGNYKNVEFRLGEIENIPVKDNSVDVVISNCVINLSPNKERVFQEAFRVLRPGGRLMVSDIVLLKELPELIKKSVSAYVGCISGAIMKNDYLNIIKKAGFSKVEVLDEVFFPIRFMENDPTAQAIIKSTSLTEEKLKEFDNMVVSIKVKGRKF